MSLPAPSPALVGLVVLNYHQPEATAACIRSLLASEPPTSRILWVENDADRAWNRTRSVLAETPFPWQEVHSEAPLPDPGVVAVLRNPENLGYGAGNNRGLRLLDAWGLPFAWVLNNDTELVAGSSDDLRAAALARPEVGAWGTAVLEPGRPAFAGGRLNERDFASTHVPPGALEGDARAYVSGCSLFFRTAVGRAGGFIPEDYFLYYEDVAFSLELRRQGYELADVPGVQLRHAGSLGSGERSPMVEYYTRRNRWVILQRYFPNALPAQRLRRLHTFQKLLFRGRLDRLRLDWEAYRDFKQGRLGPRVLPPF